jgi:hypothetical protein
MTITKTILEEACKFLLQKTISLELGNKIHKQGKLIIFYQKNFYLTFIMDTAKKDREKIEIPIPYDVEIHENDNLIYFDYRLKTLAKHAPHIEDHLRLYSSKKNSNKFWNTILTIDGNYKKNNTSV